MKLQIQFTWLLFTVLNIGTCFGQSNLQNKITRVDSLLNSYAQANAPGMAVGIINDGKIIYKRNYGLANLENRIPITDSTAFDIASVSKQFTAFVALLAEQEGRLSFEDDIRTYLPELKHLPYKITIRQLANHTHGLPDFTNIKKMQGFGDEFRVTNAEAIKTVLAIRSVNFKPGDQYSYNNTGFMLLSEVLHRIYKKDFPEILNEYIFQPLHMNHSMAVNDPVKIIPNKAESYDKKGSGFIKHNLGQMENGSSNIFTTLDDLCLWAMNFQKPTIGNREIYDKMQKNTVLNSEEKIQYGLGLQTGKYKGLDIVFHGGGTAAYRSYILHVPQYNLSIVLAGNKSVFDGLLIAYGLIDVFLKDQQVLPPPAKKMNYSPSELQNFAGTYEMNPGSYLNIKTDGKSLYFEGDTTPFSVMGDEKFGIPAIPTGNFVFQKEAVTFNIGDFSFHCKKVILKHLKEKEIDLTPYVGFYRNEEFNTIYELLIEDDTLIARHALNGDIRLHFQNRSKVYSYQSFFGGLDFKYDKNNVAAGFVLSGGNLQNIEFKRMK
ncbi:serine hydrolase domain-containing protein [Chryseobacterium sp. JK1]|uniref:serine hydrolase domain-containing protein n=1 Tax=Chryseobacterium sp. JK1 TaxID=874294 RepID=UPI003D68E0F4